LCEGATEDIKSIFLATVLGTPDGELTEDTEVIAISTGRGFRCDLTCGFVRQIFSTKNKLHRKGKPGVKFPFFCGV